MTAHPRVAIAHDYLTQRGGAERVVLAMARAFPGAVIHTTLYEPEATYPEFKDLDIRTSVLNRVGPLRRNHRLALPFLAPAASSMRIDADVVIVSSSGWAHGFRHSGPSLVYCYSPARWLYQSETYLGGDPARSPMGLALLALRPGLRAWDRHAARTSTRYLAISKVVQDRIAATYGLSAEVVPAPHAMNPDDPQEPVPSLTDWDDGFHILVSRLLPYKNVERAVAAFRLGRHRLVIVGSGPGRDDLRATLPDNVRHVEGLTDAQMRWVYSHARAVVAPSIEDYGLTPLETAAFGRPAIALRGGGYLDTILEGTTGVFFDTPSPQEIAAAVDRADTIEWDPSTIRAHADRFSELAFAERLHSSVREILSGTGPSEAATRHT